MPVYVHYQKNFADVPRKNWPAAQTWMRWTKRHVKSTVATCCVSLSQYNYLDSSALNSFGWPPACDPSCLYNYLPMYGLGRLACE